MSFVKAKFLTFTLLPKLGIVLFGWAIFFSPPLKAQTKAKDSIETLIKEMRAQPGFSAKDSLHIDLLNELARKQRFYHTDSILLLSRQALAYSQSIFYKKGEGDALVGFGNYYTDKGNHEKSIAYFQKALSLGQKINNSKLILRARNNLAMQHSYIGDYAQSLIHYLKGIDLASETDNKFMLSVMNENVANLYASQKDYTQALAFYKEVKKLNEELGNEIYSAETMSNMGSIYADIGELEKAMYNINSSISVFERHGIMEWLAYAYETKGEIYLKGGKNEWALYWYRQSEMLHEKLQDDRGKIELFNGMGKAYLGMNQDSISEYYAQEAYKISTVIKDMEGSKQCAKTLYKVHKNKGDYEEALKYHEIYQSLSDTLSRNENKKSLTMLITKMEHEKQKVDLIAENKKQLDTQRAYVNVALGILFIFIVVTLLVGRSEKIQKNLNAELKKKTKDLEKNELELQEINRTKDKLFSIIGHDLRGPIGAFQGLLKLFKNGEIEKNEFIGFMPKLANDIDHISFTLNNLLTWGQTQMNGAITQPAVVALDSLVKDNIDLLSETAKNKSIRLISHLNSNTLTWSDSNQIDIVIRNLISNAIKFTPENGMVTISAIELNQQWQISIRDTGVGMDQDTIEKLFIATSSVTTYGTNNEKGTGLGLSLCKEMVEKNNGAIWVESSLRKGSTFHFTLPKANKNYQKTA
ncbi:tetratricopeptide repeat-containing sensor histidine kinase [Zobellia galactanivorans]|uniref:histidine kinase n=1 Tax=Zobellia galactanivorans (strain DSM 12802 / CCUG 47099 / CIP 106680 / NCIMB 13871 / Dsij) TaxID=63186 RepID=G0L2H2_ZOBGA|nr:tetratricopeptide repeat-containing sensor histidine kinase [Zobellia galactanivorans]MBU3024672.1 tetratricopeptide repeat-containing sensor histidine kinase [Zobellia galactanivorans]MDO6807719.1 tetratricopeptide repeat-containing sensor histidine kinase [Zobellia galactanivorans]CAZ98140.1 Two-component system-Sensor histidine kinase [Zobellia galactanivorans]